MTSKPRYVFDTNVFISAIIYPNSSVRAAFVRAQVWGIILLSSDTLVELERVIRRRKFDRYLSLAGRLEFVELLKPLSPIIAITVTITDCRDPKDNKFLELAVSGTAAVIVSGDEDLLVLHPFRGIDILTPAAFLALPLVSDEESD